MPPINIGIHISSVPSTNENIQYFAQKYKMTTAQIFIWQPKKLLPIEMDLKLVKDAIAKSHINMYVHSTYLTHPWGKAPYNFPLCLKQLVQSDTIGAKGVVFHIPKMKPEQLAPKLKQLIELKPKSQMVLLENRALKPDPSLTYSTPSDFNNLIDACLAVKIPKSDICLAVDTAHLHSSGINIKSYQSALSWLSQLKYPECIRLFHFNGSASNNFQDKHAVGFSIKDVVWHKTPYDQAGARAFIEFAQKYHIDLILECNFARDNAAAVKLIDLVRDKTK